MNKRVIRLRNATWWLLVLGMLPCLAGAAEFTVQRAGTVLHDKVYVLDARIDYDPSPEMLEALHKGVPLVFEVEIQIERSRDYVWNETLASLLQRYQLRYQALTDDYVVTNLNSGAQESFPSITAALSSLGNIRELPVIDKDLLAPGETYIARLRASFDIESLPVPLRVTAYFSGAWRVGSEWYVWPLE